MYLAVVSISDVLLDIVALVPLSNRGVSRILPRSRVKGVPCLTRGLYGFKGFV
jgi:hypothetical protein